MQEKVNQNDFSGQNIYVGIDVHLKSWKVTWSSISFKAVFGDPEDNPIKNAAADNVTPLGVRGYDLDFFYNHVSPMGFFTIAPLLYNNRQPIKGTMGKSI